MMNENDELFPITRTKIKRERERERERCMYKHIYVCRFVKLIKRNSFSSEREIEKMMNEITRKRRSPKMSYIFPTLHRSIEKYIYIYI